MAMQYKYRQNAGALQEAALPQAPLKQAQSRKRKSKPNTVSLSASLPDLAEQSYDDLDDMFRDEGGATLARAIGARAAAAPPPPPPRVREQTSASSLDSTRNYGRYSMFFYTLEEGQKVLIIDRGGAMQVVEGPRRIWRWGKSIRRMKHHIAHPGEFLIMRYRDGRQDHRRGPAHVWFDPREHLEVSKEDLFQIADREAVVVYSKNAETGAVERRIAHGPLDFMPGPGEWLHTFSWHGSRPGPDGSYQKVPNALVFQKLWLLPDQMYHDVPEVRTADGAVLTLRLMLFFELLDIDKMLKTTHDPIGDFVNAATSDVVEFSSRHDFESFKDNIEKLNDLATYRHLTGRAEQCGYRIGKVVYRGYGAPEALQQMHEQALESRTRLQLEKDTEKQAQELEDLKLERRLARASKERDARAANQEQDIELAHKRDLADLERELATHKQSREQAGLDAEDELARTTARDRARLQWLNELRGLGVELTDYLTQGRSDQVIELRGPGGRPTHVHLDARPERPEP